MYNFMGILPPEAEMSDADRQADIHDKANCRFSPTIVLNWENVGLFDVKLFFLFRNQQSEY